MGTSPYSTWLLVGHRSCESYKCSIKMCKKVFEIAKAGLVPASSNYWLRCFPEVATIDNSIPLTRLVASPQFCQSDDFTRCLRRELFGHSSAPRYRFSDQLDVLLWKVFKHSKTFGELLAEHCSGSIFLDLEMFLKFHRAVLTPAFVPCLKVVHLYWLKFHFNEGKKKEWEKK